MSDVAAEFGRNLRARRKALKLTQDEVARRAGGLTRSAIAYIEAGQRGPQLENLMRLCTALEVSPNDLLRPVDPDPEAAPAQPESMLRRVDVDDVSAERALVSPRALSWLIQHAINSLADGDDQCCSNCCGPCGALQEMLDADTLDAAVGGTDMPGYDWWTGTGVDRKWITDRMARRHADRAGGEEVWCDR